MKSVIRFWTPVALGATLISAPAFGAGFSIFEQGTKAMGMAGAFTAQADDPSALFHNVAGIGFMDESAWSMGVTIIQPISSEFEGANPFPGVGATGEQDPGTFFPPHLYYVRPISDVLVFGFGVNAPFGLATKWDDKDNWPGRYINTEAELQSVDLNPSLAWRATDNFSIGFGVVARASHVFLERRVPSVNPFTNTVVDVAEIELESDFEFGYGFNLGLLHRVTDRFSWGFSYRSEVDIDYGGDGEFTQIPTGFAQFDAGVAAQLPFGEKLPVETGIDFPDIMSLGVAIGLTDSLLVEVDVNRTGWSSFDEVVLSFPDDPQFSSVLPQGYEDSYHYRIGFQWETGDNAVRFGYVYDETPQPIEGVGPLLPDADRQGVTFGYGWGQRLDLAFMYLEMEDRTTLTNREGFFGSYETSVWLLGATLNF